MGRGPKAAADRSSNSPLPVAASLRTARSSLGSTGFQPFWEPAMSHNELSAGSASPSTAMPARLPSWISPVERCQLASTRSATFDFSCFLYSFSKDL